MRHSPDGRTDGLRPDPSPRSARPSVVRYRVSLRSLSLSSRRTKHRGRGSGRGADKADLAQSVDSKCIVLQSTVISFAHSGRVTLHIHWGRVWDPNGDGLRKGVPHCMAEGRGRGRGLKETAWGKPPSTARLLTLLSLPDYPPTHPPPPEWHTPTSSNTRVAQEEGQTP